MVVHPRCHPHSSCFIVVVYEAPTRFRQSTTSFVCASKLPCFRSNGCWSRDSLLELSKGKPGWLYGLRGTGNIVSSNELSSAANARPPHASANAFSSCCAGTRLLTPCSLRNKEAQRSWIFSASRWYKITCASNSPARFPTGPLVSSRASTKASIRISLKLSPCLFY